MPSSQILTIPKQTRFVDFKVETRPKKRKFLWVGEIYGSICDSFLIKYLKIYAFEVLGQYQNVKNLNLSKLFFGCCFCLKDNCELSDRECH